MEMTIPKFTMTNVQAWLEAQDPKQFALRKRPGKPRRYNDEMMVISACRAFNVPTDAVMNEDCVHWIWDAASKAERTFQKNEK